MVVTPGKILLFLVGVACAILLGQCTDIDFDRNLFGINFDPNTKYDWNKMEIKPSKSKSSVFSLKTMLEVVSTRFSKISTFSVVGPNDSDVSNGTYDKTSHKINAIVETAALINCERKSKTLSVYIGIEIPCNHNLTKHELKFITDCVKIGNSIYPGTVEGIQLSGHQWCGFSDTKSALLLIQRLRRVTSKLKGSSNLKIGLEVRSFSVNEINTNNNLGRPWNYDRNGHGDHDHHSMEILGNGPISGNLSNSSRQIIRVLDFLDFSLVQTEDISSMGFNYQISALLPQILQFREKVQKINKKNQVMLHFFLNTSEVIRSSWRTVEGLASKSRLPVWLGNAFDLPVNGWEDSGWWKLSQKYNQSGYIEKLSGKAVPLTKTSSKCGRDSGSILRSSGNSVTNGLFFTASIIVIFFFNSF